MCPPDCPLEAENHQDLAGGSSKRVQLQEGVGTWVLSDEGGTNLPIRFTLVDCCVNQTALHWASPERLERVWCYGWRYSNITVTFQDAEKREKQFFPEFRGTVGKNIFLLPWKTLNTRIVTSDA